MQSQPIKIPKPTLPSRFAVPLIEGRDEWAAMRDFNLYTELLAEWGFERKLHSTSLSHYKIKQNLSAKPEQYEVWLHPAGVFAELHSYTTGGYPRSDGLYEPVRQGLGSIQLTTLIDMGNGGELQHRGAVMLRGSGDTTPQFDGTDVRTLSETIHSNTGGSLYKFFKMCQQYGRLLSFERWNASADRLHLDIPAEITTPIEHAQKGETLEEILKQRDQHADLKRCEEQLPASVVAILDKPAWVQDEQKKERKRGLVWDPIEFGIKEFSEAMFLAGKRWPKPAERELLDHWHRVALGEFGDTLDPKRMRAYELGPAGLSLPVALLYAKQSAPAAGSLLNQLLETAPDDVLKRWACEVDASGYTLGLRAIARRFTERMLDSHTPHDVDVLGILHHRLGNEGIVLSTPKRSLLGLPLQQISEKRSDEQISLAQQELVSVVERLDAWGLPWNINLRWRNYPNLYQNEGKPTFFQVDGPVNKEQLKQLMGDQDVSALDPVMARLEQLALYSATSIQGAGVRTRPRF
jgi:hypothetical protein